MKHTAPVPPSRSAYTNYKCRCAECRAHCAAYAATRRAHAEAHGIPAKVAHGTASSYRNYGCKCDACVEAHYAECRAWYHRRRAQGWRRT